MVGGGEFTLIMCHTVRTLRHRAVPHEASPEPRKGIVMSDRNYWTTLRQRKISRRTMLGASAKAGVGAAGLALVGCGDDDDDAAPAPLIRRRSRGGGRRERSARLRGVGRGVRSVGRRIRGRAAASRRPTELIARPMRSRPPPWIRCAPRRRERPACRSAASDAACRPGPRRGCRGRRHRHRGGRAGRHQRRRRGRCRRRGRRWGGVRRRRGGRRHGPGDRRSRGRDGRRRRRRGPEPPRRPGRPPAHGGGRRGRHGRDRRVLRASWGRSAESILSPFDRHRRIQVADDSGNVDQQRNGSFTNYHSHAAVFNAAMERDPRDANPIPSLAAPEWIDRVTVRASVVPAPFHDGSILTAHDLVFSYDRMGALAEYHDGAATTDHPGGWAPSNPARSAESWVRNEAVDDRTWAFELAGPCGLFHHNLAGVGEVAILSRRTSERRGMTSRWRIRDGHGPLTLRQRWHTGRRGLRLRAASRRHFLRSTTPASAGAAP